MRVGPFFFVTVMVLTVVVGWAEDFGLDRVLQEKGVLFIRDAETRGKQQNAETNTWEAARKWQQRADRGSDTDK